MNTYKQSIALIGTSADPPTLGHQSLLKGLIKLFPKVITWASDNPYKNHTLSLDTRCKLLKALVDDIDSKKLEIKQNISSPRTIYTLEKASREWPEKELVFVVGSDLIEQILSWSNVAGILKKAKIAIAQREGWPVNQAKVDSIRDLGGSIDYLPLNVPKSSSSSFRENIKKSEIPNVILALLKKNNLYGVDN
tara:strand:- start:375 stop:953 length:579 start_codon:yes stop_codon:yes gene_type:complete